MFECVRPKERESEKADRVRDVAGRQTYTESVRDERQEDLTDSLAEDTQVDTLGGRKWSKHYVISLS